MQHVWSRYDKPTRSRSKGNAVHLRDDEFAGSITIKDLDGFFAKSPLVILPGQRALIFQNNRYEGVVGSGEYQLETFLSVVNRLGRHKDVWAIVTREDEITMNLGLGGLPTAEFLEVEVETNLGIRVTDPDLFARQMSGRTAYTTIDLRKQVRAQLQQVVAEYIRDKSIHDLNGNVELRSHIDMQINRELGSRLAQMGLSLGSVQTLAVGHTRYDAMNRRSGECWLNVEEKRQALEERKQLEEIYTSEEWLKIKRMELDQQVEAKISDLKFQGDEQEFTDRLRRIDLQEKILKADNREEALKMGAAEEITQLEHEALDRKLRREDEELSWGLTRSLAKITRDTELSRAQMEQERIVAEARIDLGHNLKQRQLAREIEQTKAVESEENRRKIAGLEQKSKESDHIREEEQKDFAHLMEFKNLKREARIQEEDDGPHQGAAGSQGRDGA